MNVEINRVWKMVFVSEQFVKGIRGDSFREQPCGNMQFSIYFYKRLVYVYENRIYFREALDYTQVSSKRLWKWITGL